MRAGVFVSVVLAVGVTTLSGCGLAPKGPVRDPDARPPSPSGPDDPGATSRRSTPRPTPTIAPSPAASSSGFSGLVAVACNGRPTGEQVLVVVRRSNVLPAGAQASVKSGPLCAGTWQYTVVAVTGADPMDVVTRGAPNSLTLITAGTNACTAKVRVEAPQG